MARVTQAEYEELRKAYALGVTRVTYQDRTLEFRSLEDMQKLLREHEDGIAAAGRSTRIIPTTRKDL